LNAAALWAAAAIVPGLDFDGGLGRLLLVAAVFGIVNSILRPLLTILTCPLIIITLENYLSQLGAWVTVVQGVIFVICVLTFRRGVIGEIANLIKKPL